MAKPAPVVHLRIPLDIHEAIWERAQLERRTWSQMAIIILEDAIAKYPEGLKPTEQTNG